MKKVVLILFVLSLTTFSLYSQRRGKGNINIYISGRVTTADSGKAVANHIVNIQCDTNRNRYHFGYNKNVKTDMQGFYKDTLQIDDTYDSLKFAVSVLDCNLKILTKEVTYLSNPNLTDINFIICINPPPPACKANFVYIADSSRQRTFQFIDKSEGNHIVKWKWDFGDGVLSDAKNPPYTFKTFGLHKVCLSIVSAEGKDTCKSDTCRFIDVQPHDTTVSCRADFAIRIDSTNTTYMKYIFIDKSTISPNNNKEIIKYLWHFGDGQTSTEENPTHIYTEEDYYDICLTIRVYLKFDTLQAICESKSCKWRILIPTKPKRYNTGGTVFEGNYPVNSDTAKIYRYRVNNTVRLDTSMYVDTLGFYWFYQRIEGNYIVKIIPQPADNNYFPTYFGNTVLWNNSQLVHLNKNLYTDSIQMIPIAPNSGTGEICGGVILNDTLRHDKMEVIIFDKDKNPINYMWANIDKKFDFRNLSLETYWLYTEITGWTGTYKEITLDNNNPTQCGINLTASLQTGISENTAPSTQSTVIGNIYPNPAENSFQLSVFSPQLTHYNLLITDYLGRSIYSKSETLAEGNTTLTFETSDFAKGVYFLRISSAEGVNTVKKFIKY